jgi:hypothetical protein
MGSSGSLTHLAQACILPADSGRPTDYLFYRKIAFESVGCPESAGRKRYQADFL